MSESPFLPAPRYRRAIRVILSLMYLAGLIGLNLPQTQALFQLLTPFNLVASLVILLLFHTDFRPAFLTYMGIAFSIGFLVEVAGIHTGLIFGEYAYGATLGIKLWEVPLVIGINWLMISYLCGSVVDRLRISAGVKILLASALMTLLDVLIEPVAMRLDFWQWQNDIIPWQNYAAWFAVSAVLFSLFFKLSFRRHNEIAPLLLILQLLFFGLNWLWPQA